MPLRGRFIVGVAACLWLPVLHTPHLLSETFPKDQKERVSEHTVLNSPQSFQLEMQGTLDRANTLAPLGYNPPKINFEPMRFVRLENVGTTDLIDPRVIINGKRDWSSLDGIINEALQRFGEPELLSPEEKARAIYEFHRKHHFHASTHDSEMQDPLKVYNIYGYTLCGDDTYILRELWRAAGFKTRRVLPIGHRVMEVFFDNRWHLFDGDEHVWALLRDNDTVASATDIVRDHDLLKRTHSYGITKVDDRKTDEFAAGLYSSKTVFIESKRPLAKLHSMSMKLRPGESIEWGFSSSGKHHFSTRPLKSWGENAAAFLVNGRWIYNVPIGASHTVKGAWQHKNIAWGTSLHPVNVEELGFALWRIDAPYPIVGGKLNWRHRCGSVNFCAAFVSLDGEVWERISKADGSTEATAEFDRLFTGKSKAIYTYFIRLDLVKKDKEEEASVLSFSLENDLQMSRLSLPTLELGGNAVAYSDKSLGERQAKLTLAWNESSSHLPPESVKRALYPIDGGVVKGSKITFLWETASHRQGKKIADYHFELSSDPKMRFPLSPNFEKLISKTPNKETESYSLPYEGLLNHGTEYYWRVRPHDEKGVWGEWSKIWRFKIEAPAVPLNLRFEKGGERYVLKWESNNAGLLPVKYEIYASDEKGFTPSATPYQVYAGNQKAGGLFPGKEFVTFRKNLLTTVENPGYELTPTRAFYRVVAIDSNGTRSAPSDYVEGPRPFIYSKPVVNVVAGGKYSYQARSVFSVGDLSCRNSDKTPYNCAFWDAESVTFETVELPSWLSLNEKSGLISGIAPQVGGRHKVSLKASINGKGSYSQEFEIEVR